jgi:hypothetical protein
VIPNVVTNELKKEKPKMYETPKLNRVGDAKDVILGYIPTGDDIDTFWIDNGMEYAPEDDGPTAV